MSKYIPIDLGFEQYTKLDDSLNAKEYSKILAEISKPRYAPVPFAEALKLYDESKLVLEDKVRVIWVHDIERPSDNWIAREMAEMEASFGFRTSYNIRMVSAATQELRDELDAILALGHEIQYQYEDLVMTEGDKVKGRESFRSNLAALKKYFPTITVCYAHGVYKSGFDSTDLFKEDGVWKTELLQECGINHPYGELYRFCAKLKEDLGDKYYGAYESRCIGGDEFAAFLRNTQEGGVAYVLQHTTGWYNRYDIGRIKEALRSGVFF
ncbi:MAG: hypothetical protein IJV93_02340 [Lentisphaeria bacterium]|nr:hypothetical protein [Lentisphaeria bacterium]